MLMYNLTVYCNNYCKTSESFYQDCRDEPSFIMVLLLIFQIIILQTYSNVKES